MKLSCKVIEDMLPMYHDGVCSEESAALVEEHLKECPQCSGVLSDLRAGIELPQKPVDDLKPLEEIQKKWKKSKRSYMKKGICVTLAALLLITAVLTGIWYFSYAKYYFQMADKMERITGEEAAMTSADYKKEMNGYRFDIAMPMILSNSAFVRVMGEDGLILFLYPEVGGSYTFWFFITDENNESWSVHLKSDMTPDFDHYRFPVRSDSEKEHISQLLIEQRGDVAAMLDAVNELWGIDLLEYAP